MIIPALILEHSLQMPYHTYLNLVFQTFNGLQNEYNWLVSDVLCNCGNKFFPDRSFQIIPGENLTKITKDEEIQFIWGVFSGIKKEIRPKINKAVLPYSDGNSELWKFPVSIQLQQATIEIIAWDSSCTIIISKDEEFLNRFKAKYPESKDLNEINKNRKKNDLTL